MDGQLILNMIVKAVGGVGIFLLGMRYMSDGIQAIAGDQLRQMINRVTDNRLIATGIGAGITALIQSSSVTTVMVVGMVNAGVMTLRQSIGVILGADIGTTITAWIISLKIADYGLPLLGLSALVYLFVRVDRARFTSLFTLGLGMIFFGLEIMKSGFYPLRENQDFILLLARFSPETFAGLLQCVLVGAFVTAVIQSSSATVAITITLAQTEMITYDTAVALVLGENIGTTITAYLASLGATTWARRAAYAHITIKVLGVLCMLPLFTGYIALLKLVLPEAMPIAGRIAFAHSAFNILLVSIFIWMVKPLSEFLMHLVPERHKVD
ncbi:Na/Pi cotransporter family protein, partial [candidate division KSB1 bacterium]|nr:Na/Pi cotransporter family protein [candidate division KSB1 bacterium]